MTGSLPRKNQVIEVVLVALGSSHQGLNALRDVLGADPRFSVLDGVVDLQSVWQVLEAQPDFSREATSAAMCYVKGLEGRLGVQIRLPKSLETMTASEQAQEASHCPARREDIERVLTKIDATRATGPAPTPKEEQPAEHPQTTKRRIVGIAAAGVAVLSVAFTVWSVASNVVHTPEFKRIDAADFAGDIPIGTAKIWAGEVHAALVDPSWLRQPEDRRRQQLESAMDRLAARQVQTLILEDEAEKPKASAQIFGRSRKIQIRFF